jgi:pimeloyl-ACP methyl ester carboxylesterase
MPILSLPRALLSLASLAILAAAIYLLWSWGQGYDFRLTDGRWRHAAGPAWRLWTGIGLLGWSFLGRFIVLGLLPSRHDPELERGRPQIVTAPDGARIAVETTGRRDGPVIILTHGWGMDRRVWAWMRPVLERRFRLVMWDLPGMGESRLAPDRRLTMERFAVALGAVIEAASERPVVIVGHSIGGMIVQTLFRVRPDLVADRVAGIALVNTTYENPLRTMWLAPIWRVLQKPVLEPLSWLTVAASPLVWLSNWQSYLSGSILIAMRLTGFGRYASRRQVDAASLLACQNSPGVQAKGDLAMFHWEAAEVLRLVEVPTLVVSASRDLVTLPSASEVIGGRIHGARMAMVEGAGHMGVLEAAERVEREIAGFAEDALRRPRPQRDPGDGAERMTGAGEPRHPTMH